MKQNSVTYASLGAATCIALVTCLAGALAHSNGSNDPISLIVASDGGNKSSPLLYGVMFEVSTDWADYK
jgi:alpha-N-arabinofuranosidase